MSKNASILKAPGKSKIPVKKSINFAHLGERKVNWAVVAVGVVVAAVLIAVFAKFAILDRYSRLSELRNEEASEQERYALATAQIASYGDLETEYAHYTYDNFNEEELNRVSRNDVLDLLRTEIMTKAEVLSWSLSGNIMNLQLDGLTLEEVSALSKHLETLDNVSFCMVTSASTTGGENSSSQYTVNASMTVYFTKTASDSQEFAETSDGTDDAAADGEGGSES